MLCLSVEKTQLGHLDDEILLNIGDDGIGSSRAMRNM
jgi:hypothetical protein